MNIYIHSYDNPDNPESPDTPDTPDSLSYVIQYCVYVCMFIFIV